VSIQPGQLQGYPARHDLETRTKRLLRLERSASDTTFVLTDERVRGREGGSCTGIRGAGLWPATSCGITPVWARQASGSLWIWGVACLGGTASRRSGFGVGLASAGGAPETGGVSLAGLGVAGLYAGASGHELGNGWAQLEEGDAAGHCR
jgi:hypothetical protein